MVETDSSKDAQADEYNKKPTYSSYTELFIPADFNNSNTVKTIESSSANTSSASTDVKLAISKHSLRKKEKTLDTSVTIVAMIFLLVAFITLAVLLYFDKIEYYLFCILITLIIISIIVQITWKKRKRIHFNSMLKKVFS